MVDDDSSSTAVAEPVWGAPAPAKQPWTHTHTLAAIGIAAVLALGGGAVIYAATSGDNNQGPRDNGPGGPGGPNAGAQRMPGGPGMDDMGAQPIHGEFVVADDMGGFRTDVLQHGEVTEVTDTSVTARSDDGFTQTYTLNADTLQRTPDGFVVGDVAIVRATERDGQLVATELTEGRRQP